MPSLCHWTEGSGVARTSQVNLTVDPSSTCKDRGLRAKYGGHGEERGESFPGVPVTTSKQQATVLFLMEHFLQDTQFFHMLIKCKVYISNI